MPDLLQDKVVLVSGVGPGLGRSIAVRSALAGADVVLAARTESRLAEVAEEIRALGRRAVTVPTDITDDASAEALAGKAHEAFGRVDTVVHNAFAIPRSSTSPMSIWTPSARGSRRTCSPRSG